MAKTKTIILSPCAKKCYTDPLAAARQMQAFYVLGRNTKAGKPHVYWCRAHQAWHWGHSSKTLPTNQVQGTPI